MLGDPANHDALTWVRGAAILNTKVHIIKHKIGMVTAPVGGLEAAGRFVDGTLALG